MITIRRVAPGDRADIRRVLTAAFGRGAEADLIDALRHDGDLVLSLAAFDGAEAIGHIGFSRLWIETDGRRFAAVALAPLSVLPARQRQGIGADLVRDAHLRLRAAGETLSIVLGDPAYYRRFGYRHDRAAGFATPFQGEALMGLAFANAPKQGALVYPVAFRLV